jgi:hypothetical protein
VVHPAFYPKSHKEAQKAQKVNKNPFVPFVLLWLF